MNYQKLTFMFILFFLALCCSGSAISKESVGKAKLVIGKAMITSAKGKTVRLRRGNLIYQGDIIKTSKRGQTQLIMVDGTSISVRPDSKFQIEEFVSTGDVKKDKTYYKLLNGGFRSVTGEIGKKNKASFRLSTPVATMGIRGTDFTGRYCNKNCKGSGGKDGLFVDVINGGISMSNDGGTFDLDPDTNGHVESASQAPAEIAELPDNLLSPRAKKTKDKNGKTVVTYPEPDEEVVQIALFVDPGKKKEIISEAMDSGVSAKKIIRGADTAGFNAKDVVPNVIEKGKEQGKQASDFVKDILDSGVGTDSVIEDLMASNPNSASDILTAAIATGGVNTNQLKKSAVSLGVSAEDIESADTVGNLFKIPEEVKEILKETKTDDNNGKGGGGKPSENRGQEIKDLTPASENGDVVSPS